MKAKNAHKRQWAPLVTGTAASLVTAGVLLIARAASEEYAWPQVVPALVVLNGMFVAGFHHRRLWALLAGFAAGIMFGIASTWGLIGQPVQDLFTVVALTLAFFSAVGLLLGGFLEFVMFVHHLAHGKPARDYQAIRPPSDES